MYLLTRMLYSYETGQVTGHGTLHVTSIWQPFVGQKRNKINHFSLISNQVFENEVQLLNIDIEHIRQF